MRYSSTLIAFLAMIGGFTAELYAQPPGGGGGCRQSGQSPGMSRGTSLATSGGLSSTGGMSSYEQANIAYLRQMEMAYQRSQLQQAYLQQQSQHQQAALREQNLAKAEQAQEKQTKAAAREKRKAAEEARREKAKARNAQLPTIKTLSQAKR